MTEIEHAQLIIISLMIMIGVAGPVILYLLTITGFTDEQILQELRGRDGI